jgi:hypothetical protein
MIGDTNIIQKNCQVNANHAEMSIRLFEKNELIGLLVGYSNENNRGFQGEPICDKGSICG